MGLSAEASPQRPVNMSASLGELDHFCQVCFCFPHQEIIIFTRFALAILIRRFSSAMGFRHCFSSLPSHLTELPQGPRQGSVSRPGFDPALDAAGNTFPEGEHDSRIMMTVDTLPRKRQDVLAKFDRTGAAGCGSPRVDVRALDIDDRVRRARSEPPQAQPMRAIQCKSLQAFGVPLAIDSGLCGRRHVASPRPLGTTRHDIAGHATRYGDIAGVMVKKHFPGNRSPRETLSPRLSARPLECVDIDSHAGRARPQAQMPGKGIIPQSSPCFSLACEVHEGSWRNAPRCHSFDYFEKTLQAERYAKSIGRPHVDTDKELNRTRLALAERLTTINDLALMESADGAGLEVAKIKQGCVSVISTTASEGSISPSSEHLTPRTDDAEPVLNKTSDLVFPHGKKYDAAEHADSEQPDSMPLGLRRVIASLGPDAEILPGNLVRELQHAVASDAQAFKKLRQVAYNGNVVPRRASPRRKA